MGNTVEGTVQYCVDIKIDAQEMATWEPWRIEQFFTGIAAMIKARDEQPPPLLLTYRPDLPPGPEVELE